MQLAGIVFDMDGVLFDTERISREIFLAMADKYQMDGMEELYPRFVGRNHTDTITLFHGKYGQNFPAEEFLNTCAHLHLETVQKHGLPLKKGAREIVAFLQEKRVPRAICSSTDYQVILDHLRQVGMEDSFTTIVGGDMVAHSKPLPDIYQKACENLGLSCSECMGVEDSPNGIRSCSCAGLVTIMIPDLIKPTKELTDLCDGVFEDLTRLQDYLQKTDFQIARKI